MIFFFKTARLKIRQPDWEESPNEQMEGISVYQDEQYRNENDYKD